MRGKEDNEQLLSFIYSFIQLKPWVKWTLTEQEQKDLWQEWPERRCYSGVFIETPGVISLILKGSALVNMELVIVYEKGVMLWNV